MSDTAFDAAPIIDDHRFPCQECGADLRYNPAEDALICDHCGHKEAVETTLGGWQLAELDLKKALANQIEDEAYEELRTTHCDNCGAIIEFSAQIQAKSCAYCASPIVVDTGAHRQFKPRGVIPFKLDERAARMLLGKWLGRRWFAPSGLAQYARKGKALNAVYIPFWTYDAETETEYAGERGDIYYETRGMGKEKRRVAKVRWRARRGRVRRFFDDILILGSKSLPRSDTDAIEPWDMTALEPYNPEYLAGYRAEAYSVRVDEGWAEAQKIIRAQILRDVKFDIGGDRQRIHDMQTRSARLSFKHVLLPIYSIAYKFRGKTYRCIINGQTGRVTGERPYSMIKIFLFILFMIILILALSYFAETQGYIDINTGYQGY